MTEMVPLPLGGSPAVLKIKAGTTVTWTNKDTDAHTVTSSGSGGPVRSTPLTTGATFRHTFTRAAPMPTSAPSIPS